MFRSLFDTRRSGRRSPVHSRRLRLEHLETRALLSISPIGPEFLVNQTVPSTQRTFSNSPQSVATDGDFVDKATGRKRGQSPAARRAGAGMHPEELIALHSGTGGRRTFRLPELRKVTELFDGRTVSERPTAELTETFAPMETRLYRLKRN